MSSPLRLLKNGYGGFVPLGQQTLYTVTGKERNARLEPIIFIDYQFEYSVIFLKKTIILLEIIAIF